MLATTSPGQIEPRIKASPPSAQAWSSLPGIRWKWARLSCSHLAGLDCKVLRFQVRIQCAWTHVVNALYHRGVAIGSRAREKLAITLPAICDARLIACQYMRTDEKSELTQKRRPSALGVVPLPECSSPQDGAPRTMYWACCKKHRSQAGSADLMQVMQCGSAARNGHRCCPFWQQKRSQAEFPCFSDCI